jgi:hypothetical protein
MVFGQDGSGARDHLMRRQLDWYQARIAPLILMLRAQAAWRRLLGGLGRAGRGGQAA